MSELIKMPLVSVVVITYNSSPYLLDTLESIKAQTYKNIELIITDDHSSDDTIAISEKWLIANGSVFNNTKLVKTEKNTGISGNCNRGFKVASGEYLKIIAGDDLLTNNCIEDYVVFFLSNINISIAASKTKIFFNNDLNNFSIWPQPGQFPIGIQKQKREILKANFVYNVSVFFTKDLINKIGFFVENYPMIEDYPFNFKVISNNYEFFLLDKITVNYRVNHDSVSRPANQKKFINEKLYLNTCSFFDDVIFPELLKNKMLLWYFLRFSKIWLNKRIFENGNSSEKSRNYFTHKFLFLNKFLSNKLRISENGSTK